MFPASSSAWWLIGLVPSVSRLRVLLGVLTSFCCALFRFDVCVCLARVLYALLNSSPSQAVCTSAVGASGVWRPVGTPPLQLTRGDRWPQGTPPLMLGWLFHLVVVAFLFPSSHIDCSLLACLSRACQGMIAIWSWRGPADPGTRGLTGYQVNCRAARTPRNVGRGVPLRSHRRLRFSPWPQFDSGFTCNRWRCLPSA